MTDRDVATAPEANGSAKTAPKTCFIASPIGSDGSEVRARSDRVMTYVIDEALKPIGYRTMRADRINSAGRITSQIVNHIIDADLLVADLTGHNANVFYELAIRHAFDKPYIQLIEAGEDIPFDVRDMRTIHLDYRDLASAAKAKADLADMVRDFEDGNRPESPVVTAVDLRALEQSADPAKIEVAQLSSAVQLLNAEIRSLREENKSGVNQQKLSKAYDQMRMELGRARDGRELLAQLIRSLDSNRNVTSMDIEKAIDVCQNENVRSILQSVVDSTPPF